jgi:8-amino-7-oxononanoate synthase
VDAKLHKKLADRIEKGTLRSLSLSTGMIDFGSNDYLGLSKINTSIDETKLSGSTGSRLITGNRASIESAEQTLADFFESETGLCFNSGYDANVGIFSSIPQRGDVVLYDEYIHASARDGIRLCHANAYSFKHNDVTDLERLLEASKDATVYIALESVYSMGGDFCPLQKIVVLAKKYSAFIILDEAHSAGIYGEKGRGFAQAVSLSSELFIRLVTFGKAYGAHGAVVLCAENVKSYLVNFARSFIYTTALPAEVYTHMAAIVSLEVVDLERANLQANIAYFRSRIKESILCSALNSPIQIIRFESIEQLVTAENGLRNAGIYAKAIYPPTVSEGLECLRICIHAHNSIDEIDQLSSVLMSK